jgi:glycosyltransferase involved in cell wall biosynthesis
VTGIVVDEPRDVDAVARAITTVLDPETHALMASASRRRAVQAFDYDLLAATMWKALTC